MTFKRSDVLPILMLTRKCIHLTKLKENILTVLFLIKELFAIIGIHLGLIKILKKKKQINNKNPAYKFYCHSKNNSRAFQNFQFLQSKLSFLMKKHTHKIMLFFVIDPATSPKSHWSPRGMTYLNNIRIPRISLLLHHKTIFSYKYLQ